MSLKKGIMFGKEKREPRRGHFSSLCKNHNWCPWCRENRLHKFRDKKPMLKEEKEEYGVC